MHPGDMIFYIEMFNGDECICERPKQPRMWFCWRCYKSLPADMQKTLWQPMSQDVMDVYDEAVKYLGD